MSFEDDIKAQLEKPKPTVDVSASVNGTAYTFRIERMDPAEWAIACAMCPARPGVTLDSQFGYDLQRLTPLVVAKTGKRVDGDTLIDLDPDTWESLLKAISGGTFQKFSDAIFRLNEFDDEKQIDDLKKASEAIVELVSRSRASSGSRPAASKGGSRNKSSSTSTTPLGV